jgi:hypothetical protein
VHHIVSNIEKKGNIPAQSLEICSPLFPPLHAHESIWNASTRFGPILVGSPFSRWCARVLLYRPLHACVIGKTCTWFGLSAQGWAVGKGLMYSYIARLAINIKLKGFVLISGEVLAAASILLSRLESTFRSVVHVSTWTCKTDMLQYDMYS